MRAEALRVWSVRREAAAIALAGFVVLGLVLLPSPLSFAVSLALWGVMFWFLWRGVRTGADITWPTLVTLFRGWLVALAGGAVFLPGALVAVAYSIAAALDDLDGRLARRFGRTSALGAKLDMDIDALGILVAGACGIYLAKLPVWYLAVGLARYAYVALLSVRSRVQPLDPNRFRRLLAGLQMGFLAVALWPQVSAAVTLPAAYPFGVATLLMFVRDYRYQTCRS